MKGFFIGTTLLVFFGISSLVFAQNTSRIHFAQGLEADHYYDFVYPGNPAGTPSGNKVRIRTGDNEDKLWEEFSAGKWIPIKTATFKTDYDYSPKKKITRNLPSNSTILTKIKLENGSWFTLNDNNHEFEALPSKGSVTSSHRYVYTNYGKKPKEILKRQTSPSWYITSGKHGMDLATGLIDMSGSRTYEFDVRISNRRRVTDDDPDFIITQTSGAPFPNETTYFELRDKNGKTVGHKLPVNYPAKTGRAGYHSTTNSNYDKASSRDKAVPIYVVYIKLSDFGINENNYKDVTTFVYNRNGISTFDPAFFAYDKKSVIFDEEVREYSFCDGVSVTLTSTINVDGGKGPYTVVYEVSYNQNDKQKTLKTFSAKAHYEVAEFTAPISFENGPGDYVYQLHSVTDKSTGKTLYQGDFVPQKLIIHILPSPKPLTAPNISKTNICLGEEVVFDFQETTENNVEYVLQEDSSQREIGRIQGNGTSKLRFTFTPTKTDSYTIQYGIGECLETLNIPTITVTPLPQLFNFSQNVSICKGDLATLTLPHSENGVSYQLTDPLNSRNVGAAQIGTGGAIEFSVSQQGKYTVVASTANGCTRTMQGEAEVSFIDLPEKLTLSSILPNQSVCQGTEVSFVFQEISEKGIIYKLKNNTDETLAQLQGDGKNRVKLTFTPQKTESVYVEYTTSSGSCTKKTNLTDIIVYPKPTAIDFSQKVTICKDENAKLILNHTEKNVNYQLVDANNNKVGKAVMGNGSSIEFIVSDQGEYRVSASNDSGCTEDMIGTSVVKFSPKTQVTAQNISVCLESKISRIQDVLQEIFPKTSIQIYKNDILVTDYNQTIDTDAQYSFTAQNQAMQYCISDKADIHIFIHPNEVKTGYTVGKGEFLSLYQNEFSNGTWNSLNPDIAKVNDNGKVSAIEIGETIITFTDHQGCTTEFHIQVIKSCKIIIFNYLSPNSDDQNDFLYIDGIECFTNNELTVFNREGLMVFKMKNYDNQTNVFTGYSNVKNEEKLNSGVYFVKLDYTLFNNAPATKLFWIYLHQETDYLEYQ